jgi:hypothetical protein
MARKKNRIFGKKKAERHIELFHWMLNSHAWAILSPNAKAVLLHLWMRHHGSNNGEISYAVREGKEIGLSPAQTSRALKECVLLGFLVVTRGADFHLKSAAALASADRAREWRITAEASASGKGSREFMSISPNLTRQAIAEKVMGRGVGKSKTQFHRRTVTVHGRNSLPENATILPVDGSRVNRDAPKTPIPRFTGETLISNHAREPKETGANGHDELAASQPTSGRDRQSSRAVRREHR